MSAIPFRSMPRTDSATQLAFRLGQIFQQRVAPDAPMIAKRVQRIRRNCIHRIRPDQLLYIHNVAVSGVFRACAGPQGPLYPCAPASQCREFFAVEYLSESPVHRLSIRYSDLSAQCQGRWRSDPASALSTWVSTRLTKNDATDATFSGDGHCRNPRSRRPRRLHNVASEKIRVMLILRPSAMSASTAATPSFVATTLIMRLGRLTTRCSLRDS